MTKLSPIFYRPEHLNRGFKIQREEDADRYFDISGRQVGVFPYPFNVVDSGSAVTRPYETRDATIGKVFSDAIETVGRNMAHIHVGGPTHTH